jgi:hypothetical protein
MCFCQFNTAQSLGHETRPNCFVTHMYLLSFHEIFMPFNVVISAAETTFLSTTVLATGYQLDGVQTKACL